MNRVAVYIPNRHQALIKQTAILFSQEAGGCTSAPQCTGHWLDRQGQLVEEPVTYIWALAQTEKASQILIDRIIRELVPALWRAGEQSVLLEYGGYPTYYNNPRVNSLNDLAVIAAG